MWIKIGNTLVNLDLVKSISPVKQIATFWANNEHTYEDEHGYLVGNSDEEETENQLERYPQISNFRKWEWLFTVNYIDRDTIIVMSTDEQGTHDSRDELLIMLSDNQSLIPVIDLKDNDDSIVLIDATGRRVDDTLFYYKRH